LGDLTYHWAYLEAEFAAAQAAPLSRRKAMLVAALIDAFVDRVAAERAEDVLAFRQAAAGSPALALVVALCGGEGVRLELEAVQVPVAEFGKLAVEDFMVSLYNDHSVQRLMVVGPDGVRQDAQKVLAAAMATLAELMVA
jgi:hypothetical protein